MPKLPKRKAGIVACSGEELAEGTVTRLAALKVLERLRPQDTVTICLPLFLAGGEGDRTFARFYPTITIDGCEKRCAARATEKYSGAPAKSALVSEIVARNALAKPEGVRKLNAAGEQAVEATAAIVADLVDEVLGRPTTQKAQPPIQATCSCGSGIPITWLPIQGRRVEFVALPQILESFHSEGKKPEPALARQLLDTVRIYTTVPAGAEDAYAAALLQEYERYWLAKGKP